MLYTNYGQQIEQLATESQFKIYQPKVSLNFELIFLLSSQQKSQQIKNISSKLVILVLLVFYPHLVNINFTKCGNRESVYHCRNNSFSIRT